MTLSEFLLARIAEDEACGACEHLVSEHVGRWCRVPTRALNSGGQKRICCCEAADSDDRVLAECEAKRQIMDNETIRFADRKGRGPSELQDRVFRALAIPYAGHPDYRPEWRP